MITVWGRADSSNVQAVMWCIAELGLGYERLDVGHRFGGNDTPEFLAMNPNGTVPVIQDGDNPPLWESSAILRYLANRYGHAPFWPEDLLARTEVDRWAEWAKLGVATRFTVPIFWAVARSKPEDRDWDRIRANVTAFEEKLAIAAAQLDGRTYLVGDDLTLADIVFGHILYRYFDIEIDRNTPPAVSAYYDRLTNRPAYRDHVMISYDALRP